MIELKSVHKYYNRKKPNEFYALKGIDLQIERGEMVAIMGKSGAGKSTLLHVLGCVDSFDSGSFELDGRNVFGLGDRALAKIRNEKVGIILQDFALISDYTVLENVMTPLYFARLPLRRCKEMARAALEQVGIADLSNKSVNQLSGGQKQRVAIARAIVNNPACILADEPTGSLDTKTTDEILAVLQMLNEIGKTLVIVTHDPLVAGFCRRTIIMEDGVII